MVIKRFSDTSFAVTSTTRVHCDAVSLATRYRWRMLLVGIQMEYQLAARSTGPMAVIADVPPGQRVRLIVQAVNGNLQGVASDSIQFAIPPVVVAAPEAPVTTAAPTTLPVRMTEEIADHSTNGQSNGNRLPALR
ncbi:MAG: hypothetical protein M3Y86_05785 [Verrucomicrobiota bacterium]|nr:hypothetical protein [Verrucomicrobiota bacterium]